MMERDYSNQRGTKSRAAACLILGLIAIHSLAFPGTARSTWKEIIQFPAADGYVSAAWFFNPQVGIIGFHWNITTTTAGMVKWTNDGGKTWNDATVPALNNTAPKVTDIWFSDSVNGWLTLAGSVNVGDPLLWRSTDGGHTWTPNSNTFTGATSVRQTPNALTVTEGLGVGLWTSVDNGVTWVMHNSEKNGLDFEDNLHGVASEWGEHSTTTFLYTADGGLNWLNAPGGIQHEGYGVYAVKHAGIFVAAPEDTTIFGAYQFSNIYRSTDYGQYWKKITQLPINTTGAVQGVEGIIYVQNSAGISGTPQGLFRSLDSGLTWTSVGGPNQGGDPYPVPDTRFAVTGCGDIVYAFDDMGGVWKTTDAGDGVVPGQCEFVDNDTLAPLKTTVCDTLSNIYYLHNPNISTIVVEDLSIFDSSRAPAKSKSVYFDSLPPDYSSILPGDSLAFGLAWHPGALKDSISSDSVTIRVIFYASYLAQFPQSGLVPYDTLYLRVKLTGLSTLPDYSLSVTKNTIKTDTILTCYSVDTIVKVVNLGCDSLEINSAALLKNTWSFSIGSPIAPVNLPYYLQSGDSLQIHLQATPIAGAILFDSLRLNMQYMGQDTAFGIGMRTIGKTGPSLITPKTLQFDSVATCVSSTEIITLPNLGCDSIIITQASLSDPHFELLDTNGSALTIPFTIPADSISLVMVRFTPATIGAKSANLSIQFQYLGNDSLRTVSVSGFGSSEGSVTHPSTFDFHNVSICDELDTTITIYNKTCQNIIVDSLKMSGPFTLLDPLPQTVDTGDFITLHIRYKPNSKQAESKAVYLELQINGGATYQWDTISFSGTGVPGLSAFETDPPVSAATLAFGTLSECGSLDSLSFKVYNPGCDTTVVTGLSLDAALGGTFQANASSQLPALLPPYDTILVTVAVTSLVANTYAGNLHVAYTLADGSIHDLPFPVSLTVTTGGGGTSVLNMKTPASFNFDTIAACYMTPDTVIILTNGGCNPDTVRFNISGSGFILGSGPDSVIIPEYGADTLHVFYDGSTRGNLVSTVTINSTAQTGSNYSVQLNGNVLPPGTVNFNLSFSQMPVNPGSFFNVYLTPDRKVTGQGIREIHGVLECPLNSFEYRGGATAPGLTPPTIVQNNFGSTSHFTFDITANDIPLYQGTNVLSFPLEAMLSDTNSGLIWVDSIALNGGDSLYKACTLSANSSTLGLNSTVSTTECGDSTIILTLLHKPLFSAVGLSPNPVTQESGYKSTLNLVSAVDGTAEIELYDALGQVVSRSKIALAHGQSQNYTFDLRDLSSGSYYYTLLFTGQTSSGNLRGTVLLVK